jgi:hypothetical protein
VGAEKFAAPTFFSLSESDFEPDIAVRMRNLKRLLEVFLDRSASPQDLVQHGEHPD